MELRRLRYFATVAEVGSFHRASARLNIAQPALSRQIRDLEEELDVTLFFRSAQGVKLTPSGEVLLNEVNRLLPQIELAKTRTQRAANGQFGLVRIGFSTIVAEMRFAMAAFADARRSMPDVDFRLKFIKSDHQVEALTGGEIDVGLLYRREPYPADMVFRDLSTDKYRLLVPDGHPLTKRSKIRLADLRDEPMAFASPTAWPAGHNEMMAACLRGGLTPRVMFEADNEAIAINLVAEGLAISLISPWLVERRPTRGCTFLTVEDFDIPLRLSAMWRRERETPAVTHFVDLLFQHMNLRQEIGNSMRDWKVAR
jgi:DNA-binding transcriptional LysR family regulator